MAEPSGQVARMGGMKVGGAESVGACFLLSKHIFLMDTSEEKHPHYDCNKNCPTLLDNLEEIFGSKGWQTEGQEIG